MSTVLFDERTIKERVHTLASEIAKAYGDNEFIVVGVLTGACIFTSDLIRELWKIGVINCQVDFIGISSYGDERESSKNPRITKDIDLDITGKDILIVEDIIETGLSLKILSTLFKERGAHSVKTIVLLDKPGKRTVEFTPDFVGFPVSDSLWIEGFGLDTEYKGRGNPKLIAK
jgi:hypoxanthine phosphoribosyltransferase